MNIQKPNRHLSVVLSNEISSSPGSQPLAQRDQQDEETSDCPLLTPSPPPDEAPNSLSDVPIFKARNDSPTELDQTLNNINCEDGLAFLNIVNSSLKSMHDEPSSRDPMMETSSTSGSSSDTNEPVCTQLLTQLNTAYNHLAPDAQALFYNQENGGKPSITGIQLVVPKPPKNYSFMSWNWSVIRKTFFWSFVSLFAGCIALAVGLIATMPKSCDPSMEWWQGSLFYEIFPASFQDSYKNDGIGDLRGIKYRLDYLENLGVKGVRLNSIFKSQQYPQRYKDIHSLTDIDPNLGTLDDFSDLVLEIHDRNMMIILDLPLHPFVTTLEKSEKGNFTDRNKRKEIMTSLPPQSETMEALLSAPAQADIRYNGAGLTSQSTPNPPGDDVVTDAIKFWHKKGVDGFYLKGLEYYTHDPSFVFSLRQWKSIIGPQKILICNEKALENASEYSKNAILNRINLVDVALDVVNGTRHIRAQVSRILKGLLFQKAGYPWVHWSSGSVDTTRLASSLKVSNASVAIVMMGMMLPGTSSIFYGDEIGMLDAVNHQDLSSLNQLVPMRWDSLAVEDKAFSRGAAPWIEESARPVATNLIGLVPKMWELRSETIPIHVKAVIKNKEALANGDVRYTMDEMIVIERWYPRRNTYVYVANLGMRTQTKDLSSLYYGGYIIVGLEHKLNQIIYFKELTIPPGEAYIIKLDK